MQFIIEIIRKVVILVLLMEVVLQLQSGKQYEPYIKMLIGIMVVYSLVSGVFGVWNKLEAGKLEPMQEFQWSGNWYSGFQKQAEEQITEQAEEGIAQEGVWGGQMNGYGQNSNIEVRVDVTPIPDIVVEDISGIYSGEGSFGD